MGTIEKTETRPPSGAADRDRFRLRGFVESLPADERETRSAPVDLADVAAALEDNPKAVMFGTVGPERHQLVGNVTGRRSRIARAFGVAANELTNEIRRRLGGKPEVFEIARAQAPTQEIVLTGEAADLTTLPVHLQHGDDGAPYLSSAVDFVVDSASGWTNVGI